MTGRVQQMTTIALAAAVLSAASFSAPAAQSVALRDDQVLTDGLVTAAIGNRIRRGCDTISPRVFRALGYLNSLKARAQGLGYSEPEIRAFLEDPAEKDRIDAIVDGWLAARGTSRHDGPGLCRVGAEEIAKNSPVGRLLRMN
ncbi:MAG: DUF5333 domain-containing protein [Gemmobacter sp.]